MHHECIVKAEFHRFVRKKQESKISLLPSIKLSVKIADTLDPEI